MLDPLHSDYGLSHRNVACSSACVGMYRYMSRKYAYVFHRRTNQIMYDVKLCILFIACHLILTDEVWDNRKTTSTWFYYKKEDSVRSWTKYMPNVLKTARAQQLNIKVNICLKIEATYSKNLPKLQLFEFWKIKTTLHATHLLKLLDKMCKYEMDLVSIVEDTEQTRFSPQTDRRTDGRTDRRRDRQDETSISSFNFIERRVKKYC